MENSNEIVNNNSINEVNFDSISNLPSDSYNFLNNLAINPVVLVILIVVILFYFILFGTLKRDDNSNISPGTGSGFLEALIWSLFIILLLVNGVSYFFNTNVFASIKNIFSNTPELNIVLENTNNSIDGSVNPDAPEEEKVFENPLQKEVYHISDNKYNYNEAKAVCKAFDGELASYEQIEDAYEKGANWCSYGWSADQLALFPTNLKLWKKLQKKESNKNACGRPGINGGYIANPDIRFGVNCYGNKPLITSTERNLMKNSSITPKTKKDIEFDNMVKKFKYKLKDILVSPFNSQNWNEKYI